MYVKKNELVNRLVELTGNDRNILLSKSIEELQLMYQPYENNGERVYLEVAYKDKNKVRLLGARYDGSVRKWYIPPGVKLDMFSEWIINDEKK